MSHSDLASLTFCSSKGAFTEEDQRTATIFASFATVTLQSVLNDDRASSLDTALLSSRQIGTAIGILMSSTKVTAEQAFDQLVAASQRLNRKLRDVAAEVQLTGELPSNRSFRSDV